jgi:hypothetical protein
MTNLGYYVGERVVENVDLAAEEFRYSAERKRPRGRGES